jgi:hypothetical protein
MAKQPQHHWRTLIEEYALRSLVSLGILLSLGGPVFAAEQSATEHLEHLAQTGLGTRVPRPGLPNALQLDQPTSSAAPNSPGAVPSQPRASVVGAPKSLATLNPRVLAERQGYKRVSSLVNFPPFFPGIGIVYVKPATLPVGPFLSFDRKDRLISTIYMLPLDQMDEHKKFDADRSGIGGHVDHVTAYFNGGHPGVDMPHYHYVLWHVSKKNEALVAK